MEYHQLFKADPIIRWLKDDPFKQCFMILTVKDEYRTTRNDHIILDINLTEKYGYYSCCEVTKDELISIGFPKDHPIFQKCYDILQNYFEYLDTE